MRDFEGPLEFQRNLQQPVEAVRIACLPPVIANGAEALHHGPRDRGGVVDDDLVADLSGRSQGRPYEAMDLVEIFRAVRRPGEYHGKGQIAIGRIEQDAEQVQDLLRRAGSAGKNHDAVAQAHEGLEALLDVRHDYQLAHDGVRRLGGDDAGFRDSQITAVDDALFRVPDGRALQGTLHGPRPASRAYVQAAKSQLVADFLGVVVFNPPNRVTAPAHHEIGPGLQFQDPCIAQDMEDGVGDAGGGREVEAAALHDLVRNEHDVTQH